MNQSGLAVLMVGCLVAVVVGGPVDHIVKPDLTQVESIQPQDAMEEQIDPVVQRSARSIGIGVYPGYGYGVPYGYGAYGFGGGIPVYVGGYGGYGYRGYGGYGRRYGGYYGGRGYGRRHYG